MKTTVCEDSTDVKLHRRKWPTGWQKLSDQRVSAEDPYEVELDISKTFSEMTTRLSDTPTSINLQPITDKLRPYLRKASTEI